MRRNHYFAFHRLAYGLPILGGALVLWLVFTGVRGIAAGTTGAAIASEATPVSTTALVSVSSAGIPANSACKHPDISYDGRYIAFECRASNLVPGDTNRVSDIFVHDQQTGLTERVSVGPGGIQANGASSEPAISDDGRYVVFTSKAKNLIPPPTTALGIAASYRGPGINVYLHDRQTGITSLASRLPDGRPSDRRAWLPDISPDGRYIVYSSHSDKLVPPDMNGIKRDAFIFDRVLGTTEYADVTSEGLNPWSGGSIAAISADGRVVTYRSKASDLVRGDTNRKFDIFAYERSTLNIRRVSVSSDGQQAGADAHNPQISADGHYIVFESPSSLDTPDRNALLDVYIHHLSTATTALASISSNGGETNGASTTPVISGDGRAIAYVSKASNLVPGDTNGQADIFVYDQVTGQTSRISLGDNGQQAIGSSSMPAISGDGRWLAFVSNARNLISGVTSRPGGIYTRALDSGPPAYSISGTVLDTNGTPLPGVAISDGDGHTALTAIDGAYILDGLPAGTYTLSAALDGYAFAPPAREVTVWPNATGVDFTATPLIYTVSGMVMDETGVPLAGVTVSDGNGHTAQTGNDGTYALDLPTGTHTLTAALDGYAFDPIARDVTVPPDATGVDFTGTLLTYAVSGTVLDGAGNPLTGVTVSDGNGHDTQTGNDGAYSLSGLPPGMYALSAALDGYSFSAVDPVTVPPDATGIDFTGTLLTYAISGTVWDGDGNPLAGVTVSDGNGHSTQTGDDGTYALSGLPPGTYALSAALDGYSFNAVDPVTVPPDATEVDFTGAPLTYAISGTVRDADGNPLAGVTVSDGNGHDTHTGDDGTYALSGLPPGTHALSAALDGYSFSAVDPVTIPPDATGVDFTGTLLDDTGTPLGIRANP